MSTQTLLAFSISAILATGSAGHEVASGPPWQSSIGTASEMEDEDLLFSNNGPTPFLRGHTPGTNHAYSLTLETDSCGVLKSLSNNRAEVVPTAFAGDFDDLDDDDPVLERQTMVSRWLSTRPEIAVVSETIDKWCDEDWFSGEDLSPELVAESSRGSLDLTRKRISWTTPLAASEIA